MGVSNMEKHIKTIISIKMFVCFSKSSNQELCDFYEKSQFGEVCAHIGGVCENGYYCNNRDAQIAAMKDHIKMI